MKLKMPKGSLMKNVNKAFTFGAVSDDHMRTLVDPMGLGISDAIYGKKSGPDYSAEQAEQQAAIDAEKAAYDEFIKGGASEYAVGDELGYESFDLNGLDRQGPSAMNDITTDPRFKDYELDALRQLEDQAANGITATDQAELARLESDVNRKNAGKIGAIKQNMAARGMGGSGMEMVAQMQAAQDATDREALAALEKAGQAQAGKRDAAMRLGSLGSQMQDKEFRQKAEVAGANDAIARFNHANSVDMQRMNHVGQQNARQANWNRQNGVNDRNVDAQYDFRRDKLTAQKNKTGLDYDWSVEKEGKRRQANAQAEEQQSGKMGAVMGTVGGVVGGIYGGPQGAAAGAQVGQGVGRGVGKQRYENEEMYAARGGYVPGFDGFEGYNDDAILGDSFGNDTVPVNLSPGEVVIPKSAAKSPEKAKQFVQNLPKGPEGSIPVRNESKSMNDEILKALAKKNPGLVEQYKAKMQGADKGLTDARSKQDMGSYANVAGKLLNDFNNSQKSDIVLSNKRANLGNGPKVIEADRPEYDGSAIDALGKQGVARAEQDYEKADKGFWNDQKLAEADVKLAADKTAKDPNSEESKKARAILAHMVPGIDKNPIFANMSAAEVEKRGGDLYKAYKDKIELESKAADRQSDNAYRNAMLGATLQRNAIDSDLKKQKHTEDQNKLNIPGYQRTGEVTPTDTEAVKARDAVGTLNSFKAGMKMLQDKVAKNGSFEWGGQKGNEMEALAGDLRMQAKTLYELGVLNGPDLSLILKQIPDTSSFGSMFTSDASVGKTIETTTNAIDRQVQEKLKAKGYAPKVEGKTGGGLTPEEQAELEQLEALYGKK